MAIDFSDYKMMDFSDDDEVCGHLYVIKKDPVAGGQPTHGVSQENAHDKGILGKGNTLSNKTTYTDINTASTDDDVFKEHALRIGETITYWMFGEHGMTWYEATDITGITGYLSDALGALDHLLIDREADMSEDVLGVIRDAYSSIDTAARTLLLDYLPTVKIEGAGSYANVDVIPLTRSTFESDNELDDAVAEMVVDPQELPF